MEQAATGSLVASDRGLCVPPGKDPLDVPEIDVDEFEAHWSAGAFVLDVREADEYTDVRVPGATPIPMVDVPIRVHEVPSDRPIYVVCARGGRSRKVAEFLRGRGVDAVNVAGGTVAWQESGRPTDSGAATG